MEIIGHLHSPTKELLAKPTYSGTFETQRKTSQSNNGLQLKPATAGYRDIENQILASQAIVLAIRFFE